MRNRDRTEMQLPAVRQFVSSTGVRVYRIPCDALPDFTGRVYLLLGAGPPTLVDAGNGDPESVAQILAGLEKVRDDFGEQFRPGDIRRILVTHAHYDHIGGLWHLLTHTNARIGVHPLDRRPIEAWDDWAAIHNHALRGFLRRAGVPAAKDPAMIRVFGTLPGRVKSVPVDFLLRERIDRRTALPPRPGPFAGARRDPDRKPAALGRRCAPADRAPALAGEPRGV